MPSPPSDGRPLLLPRPAPERMPASPGAASMRAAHFNRSALAASFCCRLALCSRKPLAPLRRAPERAPALSAAPRPHELCVWSQLPCGEHLLPSRCACITMAAAHHAVCVAIIAAAPSTAWLASAVARQAACAVIAAVHATAASAALWLFKLCAPSSSQLITNRMAATPPHSAPTAPVMNGTAASLPHSALSAPLLYRKAALLPHPAPSALTYGKASTLPHPAPTAPAMNRSGSHAASLGARQCH